MAERGGHDLEYSTFSELEPHSLNDEVYGDRSELDEALDEHGILESIVTIPQQEAGMCPTICVMMTCCSRGKRERIQDEIGNEGSPSDPE